MNKIDPRDRLIFALDFPDVRQAEAMVRAVEGEVQFFKVGLELAYAGGLELARDLVGQGMKVFVDLKLHDIGNQVERAAERVAALGAHLLTVHAYPQTMAAAAKGTQGSDIQVIGVTVLTSMGDADLENAGYAESVTNLVERRIAQAKAAGLAGVVCSPLEAAKARSVLGPAGVIVTPGVRPSGSEVGDQVRVATPAAAIKAGSSYLVVGRPISQAKDPKQAAHDIQNEILAAIS